MIHDIKLFAFENDIPKAVLELYQAGTRNEVISAECLKKCFEADKDQIAVKVIPKGCAEYSEVYNNAFENADDKQIHRFLKSLRKLEQCASQQVNTSGEELSFVTALSGEAQ